MRSACCAAVRTPARRPRRTTDRRLETHLPSPGRDRRHHPPGHRGHRHPAGPIYRPGQGHPETRLRRRGDQPHPPPRLVDRHHPTHPNHPPEQTRRIDRIGQRSPADVADFRLASVLVALHLDTGPAAIRWVALRGSHSFDMEMQLTVVNHLVRWVTLKSPRLTRASAPNWEDRSQARGNHIEIACRRLRTG